MSRRCFVCGVVLMFTAGYLCLPTRRDLFDFDCDEELNCTDIEKPVCGSDDTTYINICHLKMEHQRQNCEIGNFNPIIVVHEGNCTDDGKSVNTIISVNTSG